MTTLEDIIEENRLMLDVKRYEACIQALDDPMNRTLRQLETVVAELAAVAEVAKTKLDFNYGNTLRGLSQGSDVGLLEAAQTRYESATRTFRAYHGGGLAATVEQQLRSIDPQLRLARKTAEKHAAG